MEALQRTNYLKTPHQVRVLIKTLRTLINFGLSDTKRTQLASHGFQHKQVVLKFSVLVGFFFSRGEPFSLWQKLGRKLCDSKGRRREHRQRDRRHERKKLDFSRHCARKNRRMERAAEQTGWPGRRGGPGPRSWRWSQRRWRVATWPHGSSREVELNSEGMESEGHKQSSSESGKTAGGSKKSQSVFIFGTASLFCFHMCWCSTNIIMLKYPFQIAWMSHSIWKSGR